MNEQRRRPMATVLCEMEQEDTISIHHPEKRHAYTLVKCALVVYRPSPTLSIFSENFTADLT